MKLQQMESNSSIQSIEMEFFFSVLNHQSSVTTHLPPSLLPTLDLLRFGGILILFLGLQCMVTVEYQCGN